MKRHFLIGVTAALMAFPAISQTAAEPAEPSSQAQQSEEDRATLMEARIAALKAGLKLTPAQVKDWDSLEKVLREVSSARATRRKSFREQAMVFHEKDEVIQGMKLGAKDLIARGEELQKVAEAAAPLFDSMDADQKHRFTLLLRSYIAPASQK